MLPINEVAEKYGIEEDDIELYGKYKAKLSDKLMEKLENRSNGKLILVTVQNIFPTPDFWFRSLAARWKTAYGENPLEDLKQENLEQKHPKLENPIKNALANTFVADYSLRSAAVVLKENLVFRGCVGRVRYVWKNESTAVRKALACLTAFAFFYLDPRGLSLCIRCHR